METHHRFCLHQNGPCQSYHRDYFARWSWRMCSWFNKMCTLGSKGYFFLSILIYAQFLLMYFENGPLELGYKMCSLRKQKKTKTVTRSPQKRSKPALTYHGLLSNFNFPLDLDNSARRRSACSIALTSSKYKQSAERFVNVSKHFQFVFVLKWERNTHI